MRLINSRFIITILLLSLTCSIKGQGCSDAGFCTLNSFKPNNSDIEPGAINRFKIGAAYGDADHSISIFENYLEYNRQVNEKLGIAIKIKSLFQDGNDISVFGLSDIYFNASYKLTEKANLTLGVKIPLSNGNKSKDDLPLPMDYQSSLGTFDLIMGIGYEIRNFQLIAALQQPLSQNNNEFISDNYPVNSKIRTFQSTNKFKRSGDVLLRVSYPIKMGEKFKLTPSILPIYHLTNDKYTDTSGQENDISGSKGLTLNGNVYLDCRINDSNAIQLNSGIPFVVRDARPDGLTRSFVLNLEYIYFF
jgi:hypothetical protein